MYYTDVGVAVEVIQCFIDHYLSHCSYLQYGIKLWGYAVKGK